MIRALSDGKPDLENNQLSSFLHFDFGLADIQILQAVEKSLRLRDPHASYYLRPGSVPRKGGCSTIAVMFEDR
jgi:hypothetical protein